MIPPDDDERFLSWIGCMLVLVLVLLLIAMLAAPLLQKLGAAESNGGRFSAGAGAEAELHVSEAKTAGFSLCLRGDRSWRRGGGIAGSEAKTAGFSLCLRGDRSWRGTCKDFLQIGAGGASDMGLTTSDMGLTTFQEGRKGRGADLAPKIDSERVYPHSAVLTLLGGRKSICKGYAIGKNRCGGVNDQANLKFRKSEGIWAPPGRGCTFGGQKPLGLACVSAETEAEPGEIRKRNLDAVDAVEGAARA